MILMIVNYIKRFWRNYNPFARKCTCREYIPVAGYPWFVNRESGLFYKFEFFPYSPYAPEDKVYGKMEEICVNIEYRGKAEDRRKRNK